MESDERTHESEYFISDGTCSQSYGVGWQLLKSAFWPLLAVVVIYMLIDTIPDLFDRKDTYSPFSMLLSIFLSGPIAMSLEWVFLRAARREAFRISDVFAVFERGYWNAVGGFVLKSIIIIGGFLLLIVPGIIFAIRLSFVELLIIDRKMGPIEAIRESWDMTHGHGMTIFLMGLLAIPIVLLGLLALMIGIFVAMVWIYAASTVLYLTIHQSQDSQPLEEPAQEAETGFHPN